MAIQFHVRNGIRDMDILKKKPDEMSVEEWAFALRWSAQKILSDQDESQVHLAVQCLIRSYELGDPNAAWEIAAFLLDKRVSSACVRGLIAWAARNGSFDAASWMRDEGGASSSDGTDWDGVAEQNLGRRMSDLVSPSAEDVEKTMALLENIPQGQ